MASSVMGECVSEKIVSESQSRFFQKFENHWPRQFPLILLQSDLATRVILVLISPQNDRWHFAQVG